MLRSLFLQRIKNTASNFYTLICKIFSFEFIIFIKARNVLNRKCSLKQNKTHREPEYRRSQGQDAKTRVNPEPSHPPLTTQWYTRPADPLAFHPKISALRKRLKPYARNLDTNNGKFNIKIYCTNPFKSYYWENIEKFEDREKRRRKTCYKDH